MRAFYADTLGFIISDTVYTHAEGEPIGQPHVDFFRADNEHHSLAVFTGSSDRYDHHCYETTCWNDIRDWLDHLGDLDIAPWWGPGRHGPGNNLFFMIKDPDGNNIELSAEIERMSRVVPARQWPNSRRMYNQWGVSWVRD
jgi:catechol 2,3-dioxygenase-like lactoylglutathione lyase family enzyme